MNICPINFKKICPSSMVSFIWIKINAIVGAQKITVAELIASIPPVKVSIYSILIGQTVVEIHIYDLAVCLGLCPELVPVNGRDLELFCS